MMAKQSRPGIVARAPMMVWPPPAFFYGVLGGFIGGAFVMMFS
jgi:hypothetical protein